MQKKETQFRKRAQDDLDTIDDAFFESIQQKTIRGTPDKIGCVKTKCECGKTYGQFVAIEFKSEKGKLEKLQEYKLKKIHDSGGISFVTDPKNWDKTFGFLTSYMGVKK